MSGHTDNVTQLVLDQIQSRFPIEHDPYGVLGEQLGLTRAQVRDAIATLRDEGTVRRIGASFASHKLGFSSTLCALAAHRSAEEVDRIAELVSAHPEVTHNYLREGSFNVWFTVIAASSADVERVLDEIRAETGCEVLSLPASEVYKIKVDFSGHGKHGEAAKASLDAAENDAEGAPADGPLGESEDEGDSEPAADADGDALQDGLAFDPDDPFDVALVRAVQGDIGDAEFPFQDLGLDEEQVLARLRKWKANGTIRRFGALVRHQKMGFAFNGMSTWDVADDRIARLGRSFAELTYVSHCYRRPRFPEWPFNLYAMVHAKTAEELEAHIAEMRALSGLDCDVLVSQKEYKKASPVYYR